MLSYQQLKEEFQKKARKAKFIQIRGLYYAAGAFIVCFLLADVFIKNRAYNPESILTISFLMLFPILSLAGLDAKKTKAIDLANLDILKQGMKLEKERGLGETHFEQINIQFGKISSVIARAIPLWLLLFLIILRELYIFLILVKTDQVETESYVTCGFVTVSCILFGVYVYFFFRNPLKTLHSQPSHVANRVK